MIFDTILPARPSAAIGSGGSGWLLDVLGGTKSVAGTRVNEGTALSYSGLWAAIRIVAQTIGSVPWHVMERRPNGKFIADDHPVDYLLSAEPNREIDSVGFREAMQCCAIMYGNAYARINTSRGGRVLSIENPIHPTRVELKRRPSGALFYRVKISDRLADNQQERTIDVPPNEMFHLKGIGGDGVMGYVMLTLAKESIGHSLAVDRFGSSWFGNGAHTSGFVKHPKSLDKEARKRIREVLEELHQGVEKANRVAVLDEGMDWITNSVPPEASQFLESRTFNVTEVSRWTGVPPHMLAELSRATFSNIESMSIQFVRDAIRPWAVRWESEANRKLFQREFGQRSPFFTKMNLRALMRGDSKTQGEFYRTMHTIGAYSINDVLELDDRNPIGPDGDTRFVQRNMVPLDQAAAEPEREPDREASAMPFGPAPGNDEDTPDEAIELYKESSARVFASMAEKSVNIECDRINRNKGKSASGFKDWVGKFYETSLEKMRETMSPAVDSLADLIGKTLGVAPAVAMRSVDKCVTSYLADHMDRCNREVVEAHETDTLDDLLILWKIQRPPELAEGITDCIAEAVIKISSLKDDSHEQ